MKKLECLCCKYYTTRNTDMNRHLKSQKHLRNKKEQNRNKKEQNRNKKEQNRNKTGTKRNKMGTKRNKKTQYVNTAIKLSRVRKA